MIVVYAVHPESNCVLAFDSREEFERVKESEPSIEEVSKDNALKAASAWGCPMPHVCGRCYVDCLDELFSSGCNEKPETLLGAPLGQYHCPDCGAMLLAGVPHPTVCAPCRDRTNPQFDDIKGDESGLPPTP